MSKGSCLCGIVTYELQGAVRNMMHCHCSICRKIHGAPFGTYLSVDRVRWLSGEDHISRYQSSHNFHRCFCDQCGSVLPETVDGADYSFVPAGGLINATDQRPQKHIFASSGASWYRITDDLPQYDSYSAETKPGVDQPSRAGAYVHATGGSCLCGEVAYSYRGDANFMMFCHCSRCRKVKSAAHASNVFVDPDNFEWIKGEKNVVAYKLPEAKSFGNSFCKTCGSSMPRLSSLALMIVIPAGSLDDDPGIEPRGHIYVGSKAEWFEITDSYPQYEEVPPTA